MEYYSRSNQPQQNQKIWNNITNNLCYIYHLNKTSLSIHCNSNQNNRYRNSIIKPIYDKEYNKTFSTIVLYRKRCCCKAILPIGFSFEKVLIFLFFTISNYQTSILVQIIHFFYLENFYYSPYFSISRCIYSSEIQMV